MITNSETLEKKKRLDWLETLGKQVKVHPFGIESRLKLKYEYNANDTKFSSRWIEAASACSAQTRMFRERSGKVLETVLVWFGRHCFEVALCVIDLEKRDHERWPWAEDVGGTSWIVKSTRAQMSHREIQVQEERTNDKEDDVNWMTRRVDVANQPKMCNQSVVF